MVDRLVQHNFGTRSIGSRKPKRKVLADRQGVPVRREQGPVVAVIIIDTGRFRRSPRQLRDQAGERSPDWGRVDRRRQ